MDSLLGRLQARFHVAPKRTGRHQNETVAIENLLSQVEQRIINEMTQIKTKHGKEEATLTATFERDLAASEQKVSAKQDLVTAALKQKNAATEQLRSVEA